MDGDDDIVNNVSSPPLNPKTNLESKLIELLHKINSTEIKLVSDATKEFSKLLKSQSTGDELLELFAHTSPNLAELSTAWKLREGSPGTSYILKLISLILNHSKGKARISVSRVLDRFAKRIVEENLEAVYKEFGSKDAKRQNAALLLLASVVKRGPWLAAEVEKTFNFKLPGFSALANGKKSKWKTRKAFVRFAMSFLEEGKPWLIRRILTQREMFSGVLRGLGVGEEEEEEDETVVYVLSTLRDRVLTEESKVPPGLRSVLFGSVTLERLVGISGREGGGVAAELAHDVLVRVCTDPCNGLMPDLRREQGPLKGNLKRILGVMKKLRAVDVGNHRDLVLAIVKGRMEFSSAYLEEFPYNMEDYSSPVWFGAISLAAEVISSVGKGVPFGFLDSSASGAPSFDSVEVQGVLKSISPSSLGRSVINKGLLHSDFLVKNGTLRFLLEALKLLQSFWKAIDLVCSMKQGTESWETLKQEIYSELRTMLPDPQVLLTLLSSSTSHIATNESHSKRKADEENFSLIGSQRTKKLKGNVNDNDADIVVAGVSSFSSISISGHTEKVEDMQVMDEMDDQRDFVNVLSELWGSNDCSVHVVTLKDAEIFFHSKLLDALKICLLTMPATMEGFFDFFINLLSNDGSDFPVYYLNSLLSLLVGYVQCHPKSGKPIKTPPLMYKHLQLFLNSFIFSPVAHIKAQAYNLAHAAMSITGAFDKNLHEVVVWFYFLPGYTAVDSSADIDQIDVLQSFSPAVISFLCDSISTVGNNLFRYWDVLRKHVNATKESEGASPDFGPFVICVLQKCIRLLNSASRTFSLPDKSMISVYVCNSLKHMLQTQVDAALFSGLIKSVVSEGLQNVGPSVVNSLDSFCEWRPLKNLLVFAEGILHQQYGFFYFINQKAMSPDSCFSKTLYEVRKVLESNTGEVPEIRKAITSAIICTTTEGLLMNFPLAMTITRYLQVPVSFLSSIIFLEQGFLSGVLKLWPDIFWSSLEMAVLPVYPQCIDKGEISPGGNLDSRTAAATAFSLVLRHAPFHVVLPAIINISHPDLEISKIKELLLTKLSECMPAYATSNLRLLLFWVGQLQLCSKCRPMAALEQLAEVCCILVKHLLADLVDAKSDLKILRNMVNFIPVDNTLKDAAKTIFLHPLVTENLCDLLSCDVGFTVEDLEGDLDVVVSPSALRVLGKDFHVLDILRTTCGYLFNPSDGQDSPLEHGANKQLLKAFNTLVQKFFLVLKDKFDVCLRAESLSPVLQPFYTVQSLIQYISPFQLLILGQWMFRRFSMSGLIGHKSCGVSALSVGFCVTSHGFRSLFTYLQSGKNTKKFCGLYEVDEENFDIKLIEEIYLDLCNFAGDCRMDGAYNCLLNILDAAYGHQNDALHPISLALSRAIVSTPMHVLHSCIYSTSRTKAKLLFLLVQMSSLHLSVFGHILVGIVNESSMFMGKVKDKGLSVSSDGDFILLLPAALSYLKLMLVKLNKQNYDRLAFIPCFYSKLLVDGFCNWKSFVVGNIFLDSSGEVLPSSNEELINLIDDSLLGKSIQMLQCHFALGGEMKLEERLKLCGLLLSCSDDEFLDSDSCNMKLHSLTQCKNHITGVVAKITVCRLLLFPKNNDIVSQRRELGDNLEETCSQMLRKESRLRIRFLKGLVGTWQSIIKKFPSALDGSEEFQTFYCLTIYRRFEEFILRTVLELTADMREGLLQLQSISFLEQMMRFSLLYRFDDPTTLRNVRIILTLLAEGKLSYAPYLQLLLAHSQFTSTMQSVPGLHNSHTSALFRPISSILRSLSPHTSKKNFQSNKLYLRQLEIVKLLRLLVHLKLQLNGRDPENEVGINLKELHLVLLSSYGATISEIDLEIYHLMHEIESNVKSVSEEVAEMGYLWGTAALTIRKEWVLDKDVSDVVPGEEVINEHKKGLFRDNLPVDPSICVSTVLHFPYDRASSSEDLSPSRMMVDNLFDNHKSNSPDVGKQYDPLFILRFSIHALSRNYIDPVEFSVLGLLAIALISISSPDIGIRKLAYEFIGRYKNALESQRKSEIMRLRLLLTYIQNGIEEPWQKIPSIIAFFAAEASILLLDSSCDQYALISKHLMCTSRVNMKHIPLFDTLCQSRSSNFRTERLWMLRLACAGLNLDDDAQMFVRNSTIENLLSLYASSLTDDESKELIIQVVKKAVKLHKTGRHLVEKCGLLPWISSILSSFAAILKDNQRIFCPPWLVALTEVILDSISSRNISEWLQNYALEQLMDITSQLQKLLLHGLDGLEENVGLGDMILQIMTSMLKMSQKRKIYQPHFTFSFEGLFQIYQGCKICDTVRSATAEFGLKAILMSTPPVDIFDPDPEKLSSFILWAASTALKSDSGKFLHHKKTNIRESINSDDAPCEEFLTSKLLRWLAASVLLGKLCSEVHDLNRKLSNGSHAKTLRSFLDYVGAKCGKAKRDGLKCEEVLMGVMFYLQQLLGVNCCELPSVVSAFCLLLLSDPSKYSELVADHRPQVASLWSKVRFPTEANPAWRWSFYKPWKDLSSELSCSERMAEQHACQSLIVIISNFVSKKSLDSQLLLLEDVQRSGTFEWEQSIVDSVGQNNIVDGEKVL